MDGNDIRIEREGALVRKGGRRGSGIFSYGLLIDVFGIDVISGDIEFFGDIVNRDVGQHENFMGWKYPEVAAYKNNRNFARENGQIVAGKI